MNNLIQTIRFQKSMIHNNKSKFILKNSYKLADIKSTIFNL